MTWLVWIGWCTGVVNLTQAAERAAIESSSNLERLSETVRERDDKEAA